MTTSERARLRRRRRQMARHPHAWQYLLGMAGAFAFTWAVLNSYVPRDSCTPTSWSDCR